MGRRADRPSGAFERRSGQRTPASRLLIVCGAARTEPDYIRGLNRHLRNPAVRIDVLEKGRAPSQVVEYGIEKAKWARSSGIGYDQLWCVVDVDEFTDHDKAVKLAKGCRTIPAHLVISNPCFELWLLLHFKDVRRALASYDDVKTHLVKHLADYDKSVDFARDYAARYPEAVSRARALEPSAAAWRTNPSSAMWRLVEAMGGCACCPAVHGPRP